MHARLPSFAFAAAAALVLTACSPSASVEGPGSGKLTLYKPSAVSVHRGGMTKTDIRIARSGLQGDVAIRFSNLPAGVDVVESDNRIVGEAGTYTLRARDDAALVEGHSAEVTASAGPGNIAVTEAILVDVTARE